MAQHDYNIANQSGQAFRADLNNALAAIVSGNSGASAPSTTFAYQYWVDTSSSPALMKQRNAANNAWVTLGPAGENTNSLEFTQAGTGAVTRTVDSKLKDVVSAKDFGAVGDGVTDDTAAVQAAFAATRGCVFFPKGQYLVSSGFTLSKPTKILGEGAASQINFTGGGTLFTLQVGSGGAAYQDAAAPYIIEAINLIKVETVSNPTAQCCIELQYTGSVGIVGQNDKLILDKVYIGVAGNNAYWKKGLYLYMMGGTYITNTSIVNSSPAAEADAACYGVHIKNTTSGHNIIRALAATNFYVNRFYRCVYVEGSSSSGIESVYLSSGELLGSYGVVTSYLEAVGLSILHFDVLLEAVTLTNTNVVRVSDCDIRSQRGSVTATSLIKVVGNYLAFVSNAIFAQRQSVGVFDITGTYCQISNNFLAGQNAASSKAFTIGNPSASIFLNGNSVSNVSGTPSVTDNSGGTSVFYQPPAKWDGTTFDQSYNNGKVYFTNNGFLKASQTGTYEGPVSSTNEHQLLTGLQTTATLRVYATNTSYQNNVLLLNADRAANSSYGFLFAYSAHSSAADVEYNLRGDGNAFCDGSWNGGGADYAEYFEWSDNNPGKEDRRGVSVVLDGDKIRPANAGEDPIGVISGNPSVVGDSAWNKWSGKHLRDDYGTYLLEDYDVLRWTDEEGSEKAVDADSPDAKNAPSDAVVVVQQRRKLNPNYNPTQEYIAREKRPEWGCVGLLGKLRIRKGQPVGKTWIRMREVSDTVEEWLIR